MFEMGKAQLRANGMAIKQDMSVHATLPTAPGSPKNKQRDDRSEDATVQEGRPVLPLLPKSFA